MCDRESLCQLLRETQNAIHTILNHTQRVEVALCMVKQMAGLVWEDRSSLDLASLEQLDQIISEARKLFMMYQQDVTSQKEMLLISFAKEKHQLLEQIRSKVKD